VRRAEELSTSAANALLKTLEEPGARTHFVLLSAQPDLLLPTILSRTQRVRFASLPEDVVARLVEARGTPAPRAREVARLSGGSVEAALTLADPELSAAREAFVERALQAIDAPDLGPALDLAEEAKKQRDATPARVLALASALGARAVAAAGAPGREAEACAARYGVAVAALEELEGNASPQLVVESMLAKMRAL
jgi:DNA polymerase-3 subunit delta'